MNIYEVYNLAHGKDISSFNRSAIDNYILAKIQRSGDHARRIILDPEDYEQTISAAAADLAHKIQSYFK